MQNLEPSDPIYYRRRSHSDAIRLIWYESSTENKDAYEQSLRKLDPDLEVFSDSTLCIAAIRKLRYEECKSIFLITSSSLAKKLLPNITVEVHSIFIQSPNKAQDEDLINHPKVHIVSDSSSDLIDGISITWTNLKHGYVKEDEQESLRNLNKETASFLWFSIFRNVVEHLHKSNEAKSDMIRCLEQYFRNNDQQLKRVRDFAENYQPHQVFRWYTQPSFISDVINKALRSLDLDALFDLRYFIIDLCHLLKERRKPENEIVYRGVLMDKDKFDSMQSSINKDDLISMRGFLSTSRRRNVAERFCDNNANDPTKVEIIYKIHVASNLEHTIFVDIGESSAFEEEKEILFDLDSTFELISITPDETNNNRYIVELNATDRGWFLTQEYISFNNQELVKQSPELLFGVLLIDMGDYDKAIDYFQRLLDQRNNATQKGGFVLTKVTHTIILNNLGHAWYKKGNFNKAMEYFDAALDLVQSQSGLESHIADSLNNKAVILMENGQYRMAFEEFQKALDIRIKNDKKDKLSHMFGNMGTIKNILGEYDEALRLYERAGNAMLEEGVHENHQDIASNKLNIGFVYLNQARWTDAERTLKEAKAIYEHILPGTHRDIGRMLFSIGIALRSQGKFDEGFEFLKQALNVYEKAYGQLHSYIADTYNSMANIKSIQDQFEEALPLYQKAYEQFRALHGTENNASSGRVINNIGKVYQKLNRLPEALEHLERALLIRQTALGANHPDTATTLVNISLVYQTQGDLRTALEYAKRGLAIRREKLPVNNEDLIETEELVIQLENKISIVNDNSTQSNVEEQRNANSN